MLRKGEGMRIQRKIEEEGGGEEGRSRRTLEDLGLDSSNRLGG